MSDPVKHPLVESLARQVFVAHMGHTGMTWDQLDDEFGKEDYRRQARTVLEGWYDTSKPFVVLDMRNDQLWLIDGGDHFVTFDENGWLIEHSLECRLNGTLGTCEYDGAVREVADDPDPDLMGRWRITDVDSDGMPILERAEK